MNTVNKHKNLVVDLNNIVFSTRHLKLKTPTRGRKEQYVAEKIFKDSLHFIVRIANEMKATSIAIACDSSKVWRKNIFPDYKGQSDHSDVYYDDTIEAANMLKRFFRECTNVGVFEVPHSEADDIIAVIAQESIDVENVILSSDRDFVQLINENTSVYSPAQGWRISDDPKYDLFVKCIRGDVNDNIASAYPRVWEKKLKEAWEDDLSMLNLMETVRRIDGKKVGDVYAFNCSLIDLSKQPAHIRQSIEATVRAPIQRQYGELRMMKWLGDNNLKKYAGMLAYKERPLKGMFKMVDK